MGSFFSGPGDKPLDVPPVTTPDLAARAALAVVGLRESGFVEHILETIASCFGEILKTAFSVLASVFDDLIALLLPFLTASQGTQTSGFFNLVAAVMNDLLGVEVAGAELAKAHDDRGLIGGMQQVGKDFMNVLLNEFTGREPSVQGGEGLFGLPGKEGEVRPPEDAIKGATAFLGFILSFGVRQGNLAVLSDALSVHLLGQMREYGELMAKNLGLGRLSRMIFRPLVTTLVAGPLQRALNKQYRPHEMDAKQLAGAYLRGHITREHFLEELRWQGWKDDQAQIQVEDTLQRLNHADLFILHDTGIIGDVEYKRRIRLLGFDENDFTLLLQAEQMRSVQATDRAYANQLALDFIEGQMSQGMFEYNMQRLRIPRLEADAITRNAIHRKLYRHKHLSVGFIRKAYLNGTITISEYLDHARMLGYSDQDVDILEMEILVEQKAEKAKLKAAQDKVVTARAHKTGKATKPPTTPTPPSGAPPEGFIP